MASLERRMKEPMTEEQMGKDRERILNHATGFTEQRVIVEAIVHLTDRLQSLEATLIKIAKTCK